MKLHELRPAKGATKNRKRIARGQGSGHGGTATKGEKGQKSRTGDKRKTYFEGGGITLWERTPKRGFKNINREEFVALNLSRIQHLADKYSLTVIDPQTLSKHGVIRKSDKFKVLAHGELTTKVTVSAHACSGTAKAAIEALGGSVTLL